MLGMHLTVNGPKGVLERDLHPDMIVAIQDKEILVTRPSEKGAHRALHGLTRALIQNMVTGVTPGFEMTLKIEGARAGRTGSVRGPELGARASGRAGKG